MPVAVAEHSCCFHWDIHNPFIPWHELEATFYDGSPTVTRWKVTLLPLMRRLNKWTFEFSLKFDPSFDERDEIVASRVQVSIYLNDQHITDEDVLDVWFRPRNRLSYSFQFEAFTHFQYAPRVLFITITLHLPGRAVVNQYMNIPDRNVEDPTRLSIDLLKLSINPRYSNMLLSATDGTIRGVHSYIIGVRWTNFFVLHPFNPNSDTVATNISSAVLQSIITYLYSGVLNFQVGNSPYITELFHVMDKYKLYHLYKVLVKDDLHQKRVTTRKVIVTSFSFELTDMLGSPNVDTSRTWLLNQNTPCVSVFTIGVRNCNGQWLLYSLKSNTSIKVYARVNLLFKKKIVGASGTSNQTLIVHECDYKIDPFQVVDSGPILFLGCQATFGDLNPVDRYGRPQEVDYYVECILRFGDGGKIEIIQSSDNALRDEMEQLNVLGDHLLKLRTAPNGDLRVIPRSVIPENENQPQQEIDGTCVIHKAIFYARVPHWWKVCEGVQEMNEMPDSVRLSLRSEALPFVLDYIYTSRVFTIPHDFLAEIARFADAGRCISLQDFVYRIRFQRYIDLYG